MRQSFGSWVLPLPERPEAKYKAEWERIPNLSLRDSPAPFGYVEDPDEEGWLLPVAKELELLELAKDYVKRYSYESVANWLSDQSGRFISESGLFRRIKVERERKRLASIKRTYAAKLQKALDKIEKLEHQRLGAKASRQTE